MTVLATVVDPRGRRVELTSERWNHILDRHPEIAEHRADVLRAIDQPSAQLPGRHAGQTWFYLAEVGPSGWLKVIVDFDQAIGQIITAFPRRSFP